MKKILLSLAMIAVVGSLSVGATSAIFSDDEVSTGNTFTAGAVDLTIDNESYYNGELNEGTTWLQPANLDDGQGPADGAYLFFNFDDVKPGDWGEDTISLHINDNPSWACVDVTLRSNDDNGLTEPEADDGDVTDGEGEGELADAINFMWWADDGDNVYEDDEVLLPAGNFGQMTIDQPVTIALADSSGNIWDEEGPMPGDEIRYIGKAWCLGDMNEDAVAQDGVGAEGDDNGPLDRGTGFTCDGAPVDNVTQTDSMSADIAFHVEQARHNGEFMCEPLPEETTITVTKVVVNEDGDAEVEDFDLFIDDLAVTSGVAQTVQPGTYTISEEGPDGYAGVFSGDCDVNGEITVEEFDQASCTITNTEVVDPILTVDKFVSTSDPQLSVSPSNFEFTLTDESDNEYVFTDEVPDSLPAGTYTITEEYVGGQNIAFSVLFSSDCSEIGTSDTGTITVEEGESFTCVVTNQITAANSFNSNPIGDPV